MNDETSLPRGWTWAKLGEVLPISYGKALSAGKRNKAGNVPVFGSSGKVGNHDNALTKRAGLIIGRKGNVGSVYFSEDAFWPIDTVYFTEGNEELELKFFYYLLGGLNLRSLDRSTAVPGLSRNDYDNLKIPLAPLAEQKRIAAKLEELLSEIEAGVAAIERARGKVRGFRASLLRAATTGELSARWRADNPVEESGAALLGRIESARRAAWEEAERAKRAAKAGGKTKRLFEDESWKANYRAPQSPAVAALPALPDSWCWASVEQLSTVVRGASPRPAGDPKYFGGSIPWITVGSITSNDESYLTKVKDYVTEAGRDASRYIEPQTLLLTNSGATLGVPKITLIGGCINDGSVALLNVDYPLKLYLTQVATYV